MAAIQSNNREQQDKVKILLTDNVNKFFNFSGYCTYVSYEYSQISEANKTNKKIDYDKLITRFGCEKIDDDLLSRIVRITGKPVHPLICRGVFFSHRDLHQLLDNYEKGNKFYLYTGLGPTVGSLHLGHLIPLIMAK